MSFGFQFDIMPPLPGTTQAVRSELEYLQKELRAINSQLPDPFSDKSITLREWSSVEDGQDIIIGARKDLFNMRELWVKSKFKRR